MQVGVKEDSIENNDNNDSRVEDGNTQLLVLDDIAEMNCIIKYLMDEFPSQPATKYAIGLQTPDQYKGVYEWRTGMQ